MAEHPLLSHEENLLNELVERAVHRIGQQFQSGLRQSIADGLWAKIPIHVAEGAWNASATTLTWQPWLATDTELITHIVTYLPSGETGFLQFGNSDIVPVASGITSLRGKWILAPGDARSLIMGTPGSTAGQTPGLMYAHLSGEGMAVQGHVGP